MAFPGLYIVQNIQVLGSTNTIPSFEYDGIVDIQKVTLKITKSKSCSCNCGAEPIMYSTDENDGLTLDGMVVNNEFEISEDIYSVGEYEGIYMYSLVVDNKEVIYPFVKIKFTVENI